MKRLLAIPFITGLLFFSGPGPAYSLEDYFIEDEWVLLYKIVNWWYSCLEPDSQWLCGQSIRFKSIRFESNGKIQVSGNGQDQKMDIILPPVLSSLDQLSVSGIPKEDRLQIRSCPKPGDGTPFPVSLFIVQTPSGETLARYIMAWE